MKKALIINTRFQERKKEQLRKSILKKKTLLQMWTEKVQMLSMQLDLIKHEYNVRVGSLLLKDNQLDLEILQLKNLADNMKKGMTYEQALRVEEDAFYNEILRMQEEQERIEKEKEMLDERKDINDNQEEEIKSVWKRLIRKFHPDLVMNKDEKLQREEIMKKINSAYAINDLDALKNFEEHANIEMVVESSIEDLEKMLVNMENMIFKAKIEYSELKFSQWYGWRKKFEKAKKAQIDIFKDLENNLLNDIAKKITILQKLRVEVKGENV